MLGLFNEKRKAAAGSDAKAPASGMEPVVIFQELMNSAQVIAGLVFVFASIFVVADAADSAIFGEIEETG
jgi:hypothetical protein